MASLGIDDPEASPAIYAYSQTWADEGTMTTRTGFIARLEVANYDQKVVLPHEFTLAGPKIDRLNLTRATQTTLSPIFCVYNDPTLLLETRIFGTDAPADAIRVSDPDGVKHVFWPVTDPSFLSELQSMLAEKSVIIADGRGRLGERRDERPERPHWPGRHYHRWLRLP